MRATVGHSQDHVKASRLGLMISGHLRATSEVLCAATPPGCTPTLGPRRPPLMLHPILQQVHSKLRFQRARALLAATSTSRRAIFKVVIAAPPGPQRPSLRGTRWPP